MRPLLLGCAAALALATTRPRADDAKPPEKPKALDAVLRITAASVGAYLYEAHQKIGLLGDARAKGVYTADVAAKELAVSVGLLKLVDAQLAALDKADIAAAEKKVMAEARQVIALQLESAEGLRKFWKNDDKEAAAAYTKNRDAAWVKLQAFLRVKKPAEKKGKE